MYALTCSLLLYLNVKKQLATIGRRAQYRRRLATIGRRAQYRTLAAALLLHFRFDDFEASMDR